MKITCHNVVVFTIIFTASLISCSNSNKEYNKKQVAERGVFDLHEWDFNKNGVVELNGKWEFYWNQFIKSDEINFKAETNPEYILLPGLWNNHLSNGKPIGNKGYASYRLTVKLKKVEELAIKYLNAAASCEIYIDGALLYNSGQPGKIKENTIPGFRPEVITFLPQKKEFEIVLQIANFQHKKGGQWEPLVLGTKSQVIKYSNLRIFLEILSAGFIFIIALFYLTVFSRFPYDRPLLYFAIFSFFISIRFIVNGEFSIFMLGDFSWAFVVRTSYLSFYLAILFFIIYFKSLFPDEVKNVPVQIISIVSILFSASVILLPPISFSYGMIYFQLFTIISGLYVFYLLPKILKNKREGAQYFLYGFFVLFICMIHDILRVNEIIYSIPLSSFGLTIFILMQAYFLSINVRRAFEENKILSIDLQKQNKKYLSLNEKYKEQNKNLIIAKEKAEESDHLKSAFLANMSHEIRTPMNGILGFAELLNEPNLNGEQQKKYIGIIQKSGIRMLNIINDIIDISKIEAGLAKVETAESNINEQIEYIYTFFKPEAEAKGMKLTIKNTLPSNKAIINTDREKVFAILTNLVKNAIKYTDKGTIEFGYEQKGRNIEFFVKDTGIGINKNRRKAIFERFIKADINDKMARQGAGLGLSITKAYVEMLGGKIWIESQEGIGSTFYFTLPYNTIEDSKIVKKIILEKDEVNQIKNLKILIAEDDETSGSLITILVKKLSREIIKVTTGIEAIEICRKTPDIDLILMDIQMPEMDGYEATQEIRQFNKDVVIIAQTGFGLFEDREKAIKAGCNDYIAKPINQAELLTLIHKYLK